LTHSDQDVDIVIKLNGAMDFGLRAAVFELVGSLMASRLGIECPQPYLVRLSPEFVNAVALHEPEKANSLRQSIGWNFGSRMLKDSAIWAVDAPVTSAMSSDALKIYSFDGLIQNPDRTQKNPNLLTSGEKLVVIDHECAFSFLNVIGAAGEPWTLGNGDFMERHALRYGLSSRTLDWADCRSAVQRLTPAFFDALRGDLPPEWNGDADVAKIKDHIAFVVDHIEDFEIELQRRMT
jgi:hypothetical protein